MDLFKNPKTMERKQLIRILNECKSACEICADACLGESDLTAMVDCIRTDKVCATICGATSSILATSFTNVDPLLAYCIEVCEECAKVCKAHDHEHCQRCAKSCEECANSCKKYMEAA
jgi:hypothetical protein